LQPFINDFSTTVTHRSKLWVSADRRTSSVETNASNFGSDCMQC